MAKLTIPTLNIADPITTPEQRPTKSFHAWINTVLRTITAFSNDQAQLLADVAFSIRQAGIAITTAAEAASKIAAAASSSALLNSFVTPADTLSATLVTPEGSTTSTATITISAHTRVYGDGARVTVNAGTLTGLAVGTVYYVVYDDDVPREGGAVTYQAITNYANAAQTGDRHLVGSITTPATGSTTPSGGNVVWPPGVPREPIREEGATVS